MDVWTDGERLPGEIILTHEESQGDRENPTQTAEGAY